MLIQADAFHLPYPNGYFHAVVTSPPYWGLRKYAGNQGDEPLGLEATPERHIERMVEVFREVRRVLRDDGVLWLNYGDCYYNHRPGKGSGLTKQTIANSDREQPTEYSPRRAGKFEGIGEGSLMLMPHRLAIALQDDGWIVRNDLVWYKRNPMPESVAGWRWDRKRIQTGREPADWDALPKGWDVGEGSHDTIGKGNYREDEDRERTVATYEYGDDYVLRKSSWRHTRAHEYVFQLVKGMGYYCNQEAVREAASEASINRINQENFENQTGGPKDYGNGTNPNRSMRKTLENFAANPGRNPRSVLDVPTAPYKGSHYATFPPNLIAPLIRASVPRRCCPVCGAAYAPVVEQYYRNDTTIDGRPAKGNHRVDAGQATMASGERTRLISNVTAYRPTCDHEGEPVPGIVLDIFGGSGTTGMVAKELLRRWVVMDISRPYLDEQSKIRTNSGTPSNALDDLPLFGLNNVEHSPD